MIRWRHAGWAVLLTGLLSCAHAGDAQPPKADTKKDDAKKVVPADTPEGLRVSMATHSTEIKKRLADMSPAIRRTAMPLLAETKREESGKLLFDLALFDPDPEIRTEAFRQLCLFPDLEGKIAYHLSQTFRKEQSLWVKQNMAAFISRLSFKHAPLSELIYYIVAMKDPDNTVWDDQYDSQGGKIGGGGRGTKGGRDHFSLIVQSINLMAGRNFPANRETSIQLNDWWKINEYDYRKADSELAAKNKKDGMVGLNLVPGTTKPFGATTVDPKADQATKAEQNQQTAKSSKMLVGIMGGDEEEPVKRPPAKPPEKKPTKPVTENDIE